MATVNVTGSPESFSLTSTWYCYGSPDSNGYYQSISTATTATKDVAFDISSVPSNADISTAYIYAKWGSPAYGFNIRRINDITCPTDGTTDITISSSQLSSGSVSATFKFQSLTSAQTTTSTKTGITNISGVYLYIEYTIPYTKPTAPTSVTVSPTTAAPGGSATLRWSGAAAGTSNPITGYSVYRSDSSDGEYTWIDGAKTTSTSGSCTVTAPTTKNSSYYYKILIIGTVSGYEYSSKSTAYAKLTCSYTDPSAPTNVKISKSISTGENVTLSWSEGTAGTNNAIASYDVYYSDTTNLTDWSDNVYYANVEGTSISVPPPEAGYYRSYYVVSVGSVSDTYSSYSDNAWTQTNLYFLDWEFTDATLTTKETHVKAVHITEMQDVAKIAYNCYEETLPSFSSIIAGETSLNLWSQHVSEIRQAIDDLGISHDNWIDISKNLPSVSVMEQLRSVLISI